MNRSTLMEAKVVVRCVAGWWVLQRGGAWVGAPGEGMPYKAAGGFISKSETPLAAGIVHLLMVEASAEY